MQKVPDTLLNTLLNPASGQAPWGDVVWLCARVSRIGACATAPAETAKTSAHDSVSRDRGDFMDETIRRRPPHDKTGAPAA